MMLEEFKERTGRYPSIAEFKAIQNAYMSFDGDKDDFCRAYLENENGLAEKIRRAIDTEYLRAKNKSKTKIVELESKIRKLEEELDREMEWKPFVDDKNVLQAEYDKLAADSCTRTLTDDMAKELLYNEFGFAKEKITIHHTIPKLEVNRHRLLRQVGEIERRPLYNATDWNYIRFDCGRLSYELSNDNLRPFLH